MENFQRGTKENCQTSKAETKQYKNEDNAFYAIFTNIESIPSEDLKVKINDPKTKIVSFDIFDTLVFRPFWEPADLFLLLGIYANKFLHIGDLLDFYNLRVTAERKAREIGRIKHPSWEEITLDEIYDILQDYLNLSSEQRDFIKNKEIELELKYCHPQPYAKEIFDLFLSLGKKIIITSDMYLPKEVIKQILSSCGYEGYERLYLSSEVKLGNGQAIFLNLFIGI